MLPPLVALALAPTLAPTLAWTAPLDRPAPPAEAAWSNLAGPPVGGRTPHGALDGGAPPPPPLPAPDDPRVAWLRTNAVELATVEAGHGFADLQPLKGMIGEARVVGLGEGTHGTREFFQAKHRLLEFLATEMGFTLFSIEANMPEAYALNDYVLGGPGDVAALIAGMYFWTWRTEEVRDMVEWMRRFNAARAAEGSASRVQFTGFDMQVGRVALEVVRTFLAAHEPEALAELAPALEGLSAFDPFVADRGAFGCATGRFPVEDARGRTIRFSGWIRTEAVDDAWAGLWWRVDGPTPRFDNMIDRGPRGTSEWQQVSIEMTVPEDATAIYFGLVKPGRGKAWFDDLQVEIDGQPWSNDAARSRFDFDFEKPQPDGIVAADPMRAAPSPSYPGALDPTVAKRGSSSFLLERLGPDRAAEADRARAAAAAIEDRLTALRERLLGRTDARSVDWAIQNARLLRQWSGLSASPAEGFAHRDRCMAENIAWILAQNPGQRMVVWAHNGHVRDEAPFMGSHLRQALGTGYVNLAFCASHGEYGAISADRRGLRPHSLATPPAESAEATLERAGKPILLVDLRSAVEGDPGSGWLAGEPLFGGVIGAMEMPEHYQPTTLKGPFDLLIYLRNTSAARPLR